jgi:hypothetical protein
LQEKYIAKRFQIFRCGAKSGFGGIAQFHPERRFKQAPVSASRKKNEMCCLADSRVTLSACPLTLAIWAGLRVIPQTKKVNRQ